MNDDDLFKIVSKPIWNPAAITGMNPIVMVDALYDASSYTAPNTSYTVATVANTSSPPPSMIAGKMMKSSRVVSRALWATSDPDTIKRSMIYDIVEEMVKGKCIEFTMTEDASNDSILVNARVFVTPDDQVRILRKAGY